VGFSRLLHPKIDEIAGAEWIFDKRSLTHSFNTCQKQTFGEFLINESIDNSAA